MGRRRQSGHWYLVGREGVEPPMFSRKGVVGLQPTAVATEPPAHGISIVKYLAERRRFELPCPEGAEA